MTLVSHRTMTFSSHETTFLSFFSKKCLQCHKKRDMIATVPNGLLKNGLEMIGTTFVFKN